MPRQALFTGLVRSMQFSLLTGQAILGIKFGGYPTPTDDKSFEIAYELLDIPLLLSEGTRVYFGPTTSPQIRTEWLHGSIPWSVVPIDIHLVLHVFPQ